MTCSGKCWRRRLAALAIATILLGGCETAGSERGVAVACPPVVEYSAELKVRVAAEVEMLPADSALTEMLSNYAVLRDHVRACRGR